LNIRDKRNLELSSLFALSITMKSFFVIVTMATAAVGQECQTELMVIH